jgi:DNA helicase-2/ATP-dependent DNA helicase PcrA
MNAQANAIEVVLSKNRIPYRVYGGLRFYDRKEIKDMIAYLSVINNPNDEVRLKRIINVPKRGIGANTLSVISELSHREGKSSFEIIKNAYYYPELQKVNTKLEYFYALIADLKELSRPQASPS